MNLIVNKVIPLKSQSAKPTNTIPFLNNNQIKIKTKFKIQIKIQINTKITKCVSQTIIVHHTSLMNLIIIIIIIIIIKEQFHPQEIHLLINLICP